MPRAKSKRPQQRRTQRSTKAHAISSRADEEALHAILQRFESRMLDLHNNPSPSPERQARKEENMFKELGLSLSPLLAAVPSLGPVLAAAAPAVGSLLDRGLDWLMS